MPDDKTPGFSAIAEVRGFFETFMPGFFLLLHILLLVYCVAPPNTPAAGFLKWLSNNVAAAASAIGLPAGYVVGLALRLGRTSFADKISGWLVLLLPSGWKLIASAEDCWANEAVPQIFELERPIRGRHAERIPYPAFMMARVAQSLSTQALDFYQTRWLKEGKDETRRVVKMNLFRFNFFKTLLSSVDERAAKDLFAAEMMVRHVAHLCYALFFSALILSMSAIISRHELATVLWWIFGGELFLLIGLLLNLRLLRIGEVELVFSHCFRNRLALISLMEDGKLD